MKFFMTEKTRLIVGNFIVLFVLIGAFAAGWSWFLKDQECIELMADINRQGNHQESLVFSYFLIKDQIETENQEKFKRFIEIKEPLFKKSVEVYSQRCRSGADRPPLFHALKNFEYYLVSKQMAFGENQPENYSWLQGFMEFADAKKEQ